MYIKIIYYGQMEYTKKYNETFKSDRYVLHCNYNDDLNFVFFFCIYILKLIKWYIFNMLTFFYVYYINRGLRMSHYSLPFNQAHEKKHSNISVDIVETHLVNFNICS